jgi:hypothetical protein
VTKQKLSPQMIIHQAHSGKELCHHIVNWLIMMTTQSIHQTVFILLFFWSVGPRHPQPLLGNLPDSHQPPQQSRHFTTSSN